MENKKNLITLITAAIACLASRLLAWLFTQPNTVTYARPVKRDVHLNSTEAIHNYLAVVDKPLRMSNSVDGRIGQPTFASLETIDRPNTLKQGDTEAKGGGASGEKEE